MCRCCHIVQRKISTYLNNAANVARALGEVQRTQLGGSLALLDVRLEDGTGALTLCTNYTTHFYNWEKKYPISVYPSADSRSLSHFISHRLPIIHKDSMHTQA